MNVKTLFFPLSVTVAFFVAILFVQPEIKTVMADRSMLVEKRNLVMSIDRKARNAQALENDLNAHKENEDAVLHYLPNTRDDDRVVDAVNFLSSQSGLALSSVKIEKSAESVRAEDANASASSSSVILSSGNGASEGASLIPAAVAPKELLVTAKAVGSYESIRDVIGKLSHMDRFQDFTSVVVTHAVPSAQSADGQPNNTSNELSVSLKMKFSYLPKAGMKGSFNLPILDRSQFDFGTADRLKQYTSAPVPSMEAGAAGTNNPFLR